MHAFGGYFVEHHALQLVADVCHAAFGFENFGDVPRNRFAFSIGVGGKIDGVGLLGGFDDFVHVFGGFGGDFVFHGEVVFGIDCAVFLDEVAHVPKRGEHFVITAEVFFDGFDFVGRFDDKEIFCHGGAVCERG